MYLVLFAVELLQLIDAITELERKITKLDICEINTLFEMGKEF